MAASPQEALAFMQEQEEAVEMESLVAAEDVG